MGIQYFFVKAEELVVEFLIKDMFTYFNFISETHLCISTQSQVQIDVLAMCITPSAYFNDFPAVTVKICILEIHHH